MADHSIRHTLKNFIRGRTSKKDETTKVDNQSAKMIQEEQDVTTVQEEQKEQDANESEHEPKESADKTDENKEIPHYVDKLMRLYPQYEELWITQHGFVHPAGAPKHVLNGATLYKNKYYKK